MEFRENFKQAKPIILLVFAIAFFGLLLLWAMPNRESIQKKLGIRTTSVQTEVVEHLKSSDSGLTTEESTTCGKWCLESLVLCQKEVNSLNSQNQQSWIEGYWQGIADSSCSRIIDEWCPDYDYTVEDYDDKVESREWLIRLRIKLCLSSWTPEEKVSCIEDIVAHAPY